MVSGGDKINYKWEKAVIGLLTKNDLQGAAEVAGISVNTLLRWLSNPEFAQKYSEAKRETLRQALAKLQQTSGEAVETLREVCCDVAASPSARTAAAKCVLELAIKGIELEDLQQRLEKLETHIAQETKGRGA